MVIGAMAAGCVDPIENPDVPTPAAPDAGMSTLRAEAVTLVRPPGVTFDGFVEDPADGEQKTDNLIYWSFTGASDAALASGTTTIYDAAIADGWSGPPPSDPGAGGVFGTTLTKGELSLDLSYSTSRSFDLLPDDVDALSIDLRLQIPAAVGES